jgi:hypothetical protein
MVPDFLGEGKLVFIKSKKKTVVLDLAQPARVFVMNWVFFCYAYQLMVDLFSLHV